MAAGDSAHDPSNLTHIMALVAKVTDHAGDSNHVHVCDVSYSLLYKDISWAGDVLCCDRSLGLPVGSIYFY